MRSRMASAVSPASAIRPPLQKRDRCARLRRVALLADCQQFVAARHQPPVAGRICRPETQHRDGGAPSQAPRAMSRSVCGRTSGVSPNITRISSGRRAIALRAASTACAVPRRCALLEDLRRRARARAPARQPRRDRARPPRRYRRRPPCIAAVSTCASSVRPPIVCSAFGMAERMRVPSPAASTIARHVRRCVFFPLTELPPLGRCRCIQPAVAVRLRCLALRATQ